jgi:hypothetical protein
MELIAYVFKTNGFEPDKIFCVRSMIKPLLSDFVYQAFKAKRTKVAKRHKLTLLYCVKKT